MSHRLGQRSFEDRTDQELGQLRSCIRWLVMNCHSLPGVSLSHQALVAAPPGCLVGLLPRWPVREGGKDPRWGGVSREEPPLSTPQFLSSGVLKGPLKKIPQNSCFWLRGVFLLAVLETDSHLLK